MTKRKSSHIHQYMRIFPHGMTGSVINKNRGVWACALPDCTHFMPHNVASQVEGKLSLCNQCMDPFVLDNLNMKMDKPICAQCSLPQDGTRTMDPDEAMARIHLAGIYDKPASEIPQDIVDQYLKMRGK